MKKTDYPELFCRSDKEAAAAQITYLRLQKVYLLLLVFASITGSVSIIIGPSSHYSLSTVSTIVLAVGFVLLWIIRGQRYDKIWFDCRAIAESVKTSTWRYMMQTAPYCANVEDSLVDKRFLQKLEEIRKMRPGIEHNLAGHSTPGISAISEYMRKVRSLPLDKRKDIYLRKRLIDQKQWYENKAGAHRSSASKWFWTIVVLQILALIMAIIQLTAKLHRVDLIPIVVTLVAVFVAWSQIRRHDELTQGYFLAAQELGSLESLAPHVQETEKLEEFVLQTENTISREHTMWCARREISLVSSLPKSIKNEECRQ